MRNAVPMEGRARPAPPVAPTGTNSGSPRSLARWAGNLPSNRHSRRVALLKLLLPAIGLSLLLLVAVWPRLAPLLERMRIAFPAIDMRDARELRMLNPRYAGTDRQNRPFVVTASVGRQVPDRNDLMSLENPRADIKTGGGASVVVTAATGIYQSQAQLLDLFGDVTLTHENGTRLTTDTARIDVVHNSAQGDDPIEGHGPSGDVKARGFRIYDKGDDVIFTGQSDLTLRGAKVIGAKTEPPAVPPAVAKQAAAVEATAKPMLATGLAAGAKPPPVATAKAQAAHHARARQKPRSRPVKPASGAKPAAKKTAP